jgi:ABC-2 type transport system ATP-binding protein
MTSAIIVAEALTKSFGARTILNGVSVTAERGDVIGVLGKNGAGKTTLLEVLLGFSPPSSGTASIFGEPSTEMSDAVKARIGFVPQQDELVDFLVGHQHLALTASGYQSWDPALASRLSAEWTVPLDQRIQSMSVGERQKLSLLLALAHRPDLLVLDEPVASLDPVARRAFLQQIAEISADNERTVIFSSHIVSDLERIADKVWILKDGALAWCGELDTLRESVVRLHIRSRRELPKPLRIPETVASRVEGAGATVSVMRWQPAQREALAHQLDAQIEVENLGLEDIFLEMHS